MTNLSELGLTPAQTAEVNKAPANLRNAWLDELERTRATIKKPAAWFLSALRTGAMPGATIDPTLAKQIRGAETWIRNVGGSLPLEDERIVADYLFDDYGLVPSCGDPALRDRLLEQWRSTHPADTDEDIPF